MYKNPEFEGISSMAETCPSALNSALTTCYLPRGEICLLYVILDWKNTSMIARFLNISSASVFKKENSIYLYQLDGWC